MIVYVNYHRLLVSVDSRDSFRDVENDIVEIFYFFTCLYTNRRYDRSSERIRMNIFPFFFNKLTRLL